MGTTSAIQDLLVIAHRGGGDLFPENTIRAFTGAEKMGCDAVECDVHLTKDGKPVVIHDPDLNRVAGINRRIVDLDMAEVSLIRTKSGDHIPTLDEVLDSISIPVVIELKSRETASVMAELFRENPAVLDRCIVISFYHEILLRLKNSFSKLSSGALLAGFPVDPVSVARSCGSQTLSFNHEGINGDYVEKCHRENVKVSVWTPNTEQDIELCINAGVDSIASDRPDIVLRLLERK